MPGREPQLDNDIFFVCSVVEHIARATRRPRSAVVEALGSALLSKTLDLADVLHCEPLEYAAEDLIKRSHLTPGPYQNTPPEASNPTIFDIAKVFKRLIINLIEARKLQPLEALQEVYSSWISDKIADFRSSFFYESPEYIFLSYQAGAPLDD